MQCKSWGFHSSHYEGCRLLGYKNPVRTSQETHYVSTTKSSQLMLCKIWGFHSSHYEGCPLLEYKNPVRTSQETHYVSTTESSRLMQCKIRGLHGGNYEQCRLMECDAMWLMLGPMFQRNVLPQTSGWHISDRRTTLAVTSNCSYGLPLTLFLDRWFFPPWWWRQYVSPKGRFLQEPHGVTSQKTAVFTRQFFDSCAIYPPYRLQKFHTAPAGRTVVARERPTGVTTGRYQMKADIVSLRCNGPDKGMNILYETWRCHEGEQ
jgi:hypothetical protein